MKKKNNRPWGVFVAIFLAIIFGNLVGKDGVIFGISFYSIFDTLGIIFLNALTLVVVPLVSSSIITGVARMGNEGDFGRLGAKTFAFYLSTSLLAIMIGLFFVNVINPGRSFVGSDRLILPVEFAGMESQLASHDGSAVVNVLMQIVPSNIIDAFSKGQMLGLIFFCLLFGFAISKIEKGPSEVLQGFFQGIFQAMIRITHIIMRFLPYGVFCLIAKVFMTTGNSSLPSMALFTLTVLLGLGVFMFVALPLMLKLVGRINPIWHIKAMSPALITAFSTSSSSATLPITIECVEKRAGVSNRICSLVVPLGTSINMSGSALYECVAAMFIAQAYGIELTITKQFLLVLMSLITSIGVAGIPSASIIAILVILKVIGLPAEGIGLFLAVDRLLDMCRTTVNVFSDSCCAVLVAKSEGEKNVLAVDPSTLEDADA
jgi:proton glutamate symport protein